MSSSFPLPLNPPLSLHHHKTHTLSQLPFSKPSFSVSLLKSHICFSSSPSNPPNPDHNELLWLREEQRWLREEQRWLREEQRWLRDRELLLKEIQALKLQIEALERRISLQGGDLVPETMANVAALLQVLKEKNLIAEIGSSVSPIVLEERVEEEEVSRVLEREEEKKSKKRKALRKGSEGDEVREMQVCSQYMHFFYEC